MTHSFSIPKDLNHARILVTNDDGIHAAGINVLAEMMREFSEDVWVVAPETEQSGAGHSLTLHQPLRVRKLAERSFAVSGTPTDCVLLAVKEIIPQDKPVSLIVSGVNHGDNMAEHVTYSGTIAATMEGTLLGYPSIAFSRAVLEDKPLQWETARLAIRQVMQACTGFAWESRTLLSVNIPDCVPAELRPLQLAEQGVRSSIEGLDARIDPRGRSYYWIGGTDYSQCVYDDHTDCATVLANHIAITPISLNLTNYAVMQSMQAFLKKRAYDAA
jgi:5'-nucleotidase